MIRHLALGFLSFSALSLNFSCTDDAGLEGFDGPGATHFPEPLAYVSYESEVTTFADFPDGGEDNVDRAALATSRYRTRTTLELAHGGGYFMAVEELTPAQALPDLDLSPPSRRSAPSRMTYEGTTASVYATDGTLLRSFDFEGFDFSDFRAGIEATGGTSTNVLSLFGNTGHLYERLKARATTLSARSGEPLVSVEVSAAEDPDLGLPPGTSAVLAINVVEDLVLGSTLFAPDGAMLGDVYYAYAEPVDGEPVRTLQQIETTRRQEAPSGATAVVTTIEALDDFKVRIF